MEQRSNAFVNSEAPHSESTESEVGESRHANTFERELVAHVPVLRTLARKVCGGKDLAEDLAQEALLRALRARDSFEPGSNMEAWLFTILRNEFYSHLRRAWRNVGWDEALGNEIRVPIDEQLWAMELLDCDRALSQLPKCQREALLLVGAGGYSYEEAAEHVGVAAGTMKSRVSRARQRSRELIQGERRMQSRSSASAAGMDNVIGQLAAFSD